MNKRLRQAVRFTLRFFMGLLAFIVLYIVAVLILSRIPVNSQPETGDVAIYINSNGVHTDIVVPVKNGTKDWSRDILFSHTVANDTTMAYVAFGWGDRGFYLDTPRWADLKAGTAARAAFYLGTSAMHTRFYSEVKEDGDCIKITISQKDYAGLVKYIESSFRLDSQKQVQWIPNRSYGDYDAFYEGTGGYSLFYTCNTWANNALKAANQKAALWTVYEGGIFCHYR